MTKYLMFPGCLISARMPFIEKTAYQVLGELGIEISPMKGATCCADPIVIKSASVDAWLLASARNLTIAEQNDAKIVTLCTGCFCSMNEVNHHLKTNPESNAKVNAILSKIGREFKGTSEVVHIAQLFKELGREKIASHFKTPLTGIKAVTQPGCHLMRPSSIAKLDNPIRPQMIDELVRWTGAEVIGYNETSMCCGNGISGLDLQASLSMLKEITDKMAKMSPTHIVTPCPFCFSHFDFRQKEVGCNEVPVLHLVELYGMAFGYSNDEMGFKYHKTPLNK